MEGWCDDEGAEVTVHLRNGIPEGIYTTFDIGVTNPLEDTESLSAGVRTVRVAVMQLSAAGCGKSQKCSQIYA